MMMMMMNAGIEAKHMIVWAKDEPVFSMGRLDYDYQHKPILYGWRGSHQHYGNGRYKSSLWNIPRPKDSKLHPTMKPIELIVNIINNSSKQDDIVLDLFGGSGSTLIASTKLKRRCFIMEKSPVYAEVILNRWEKLTGKKRVKIN
jgi:site-specific DNA-methyltransferase (adenine-specific)